ncbi:cupin [Natrinema limicola JCM 13563]|uniref:Cupin n=1 Tax=Natrinema limicola JCM 13563 TaxID=1230457 RepID=M0CLB4_9EURY|nr:cupin [Natrinema limicola JCM 13563]
MRDEYANAIADLEPTDGTVESTELVVSDDVLVKAFALGPGAELEAHEHGDSTNVFHVLEGTVTVIQGDEREEIGAPGVVHHDRASSTVRETKLTRRSSLPRVFARCRPETDSYQSVPVGPQPALRLHW